MLLKMVNGERKRKKSKKLNSNPMNDEEITRSTMNAEYVQLSCNENENLFIVTSNISLDQMAVWC